MIAGRNIAGWDATGWNAAGSSRFGGGPAFKFADPLFHLFAGLERDDKLLWHEDFFARARVACLTGGPLFDLKNAEIPQFDPFVFDQRVDDCVERLLDDLFGFQLSQTDFLGNGLYDFFFRHNEVPYKKDRPAAKVDAMTVAGRYRSRSKCNWRKH